MTLAISRACFAPSSNAFSDAFEAIWTFVSDDFIREFAEEFKHLDIWSSPACYKMSGKIFYELCGDH